MTRPGTDVDTSRLESYLAAEIDVVVVETEVVHDGLNLSIAITTEEDGRAYVLRRPNKLRHTEPFNDVEQEFRVMQRLADTAVPAPDPVFLCEDESILDGRFLVMTYLEGETIPLGSDLPERFRTLLARERLAENLIDTLAELHSVDVAPFTAVCDRRTPRDQIAHATDRLDSATAVTGHVPPGLWEVADWLEQHAPTDTETALVHGDYRPSNVLFAGTDLPWISGVLDWETAFLGDPSTELGYLLLRWRDDEDPTPALDRLESRYSNDDAVRELSEINEHGLAPFTGNPGSPSRRELVARYEAKTGISFEDDRFYRALAAFMLATVWADLHRHDVEAGQESEREPYIEYMSMLARSIVSGDFQL